MSKIKRGEVGKEDRKYRETERGKKVREVIKM